MVDGIPDESTLGFSNVVDPYVMDDHIVDKLEGEACTIGNVDLDTPTINGLVAGEDQLFSKLDDHVVGEDDPQRFRLDDSVADGPWLWVVQVIVRRISHDVVFTVLASSCMAPEAKDTVG